MELDNNYLAQVAYGNYCLTRDETKYMAIELLNRRLPKVRIIETPTDTASLLFRENLSLS